MIAHTLWGRLVALGAIVASLASGAAGAASPACDDAGLETRVISLRFKPTAEAAVLVDQLLGRCGTYRVPKGLGVIAIEDEPRNIERISEAISSWDLPPRNVEVSISLVLATREPPPPSGIREELERVSETLSRVTRWTSYSRIGTATLRLVEGGQAVADLGDRYQASFRVHAVDDQQGVVHLEPFDLMRLPHPREAASGLESPRLLLANSAFNVFEGRLNLVGAPSRDPERAVFVAIEAWINDDAPGARRADRGE